MSVILDALRKLDREKLSRRRGAANIAAEIAKPDHTQPRNKLSIYLFTAVVASIAAAGITYGVLSQFLSKSSPPPTKTVPAPVQEASTASPQSAVPSKSSLPAPVNPPAASKPVPPASPDSMVPSKSSLPPPMNLPAASKQLSAPAPRVPALKAQEEMNRVSPPVQSPAEKKDRPNVIAPVETKSPVTPVVEKKPGQDVTPKAVEAPPPKRITEPTPNIAAANPASLKLSAIVWYEDPSRRFAMINGIMATEGSSVEGVKVLEINPTSVRLLHDGQYFEISMSK